MFTEKDHSFAIIAYKESPFLEDCIRSVLAQSNNPRVYISTSTPCSYIRELASKYSLKLFENDVAPGISGDWNIALSHSETPLVTLAHQDDIYLPDYSSRMLDCVNKASQPLIFFSDYAELRNGVPETENTNLQIKRKLLKPLGQCGSSDSRKIKRKVLALGSSICCPAVTYNLEKVPAPLFANDMKCDLDWQAWERLSNIEGSFIFDDSVLMYHRIHVGSETTALIKDDTRSREDLVMLKKFWPAPIAALINRAYSLGQRSNSL